MPDGDRFERSLRGGGWRSAYRIAAGGGTILRVTEKLVGACSSLIDSENSECALRQMAVLSSALEPRTMPLFRDIADEHRFESFSRDVDGICGDFRFGEFAQICGRAITRCFIAFENQPRPANAELERVFSRELISDMLNRYFFPAVRDGIALNAGRDTARQLEWERTVLSSLGGVVDGFARSLMTGRRARLTRTPDLNASKQGFDLARLNEPLRVMGV
jgi:hypothetical protein